MEIDTFLAQRVRELRRARQLTLEQLAELSGVSRSMISLLERQETSPTAAVLNKLADALGISLAALFAGTAAGPAPEPLARRADQPVWTDPASGYVRRHLTPTGSDTPLDLVEVTFPPGETVVFDNPVRKAPTQQQLWLLEGVMEVSVPPERWPLAPGDCLLITLGSRITFHNPGAASARYLLALITPAPTPNMTPALNRSFA